MMRLATTNGRLFTPSPLPWGALPPETMDFVRRILEQDLLPSSDLLLQSQQAGMGKALVRPLPLDTACGPWGATTAPVLFHLFDSTPSGQNAAQGLWKSIQALYSRDAQAQNLIICMAAKGSGKTHTAYALGKTYAPVILLRVAQAASDHGFPSLTGPFQALHERLRDMDEFVCARLTELSTEAHAKIADAAQSLLELLLLCHVLVFTDALLFATSAPGATLTPALQREMLLRFACNSHSELAVEARFRDLLEAHAVFEENNIVRIPSSTRMQLASYLRERLDEISSTLGAPFFIVWDEISTLAHYWNHVFLQKSTFLALQRQRLDLGKHGPWHTDIFTDGAIADEQCRSGFYSAVNIACKLWRSCRWPQVFLGTALEFCKFHMEASVGSSCRQSAILIEMCTMLSLQDMLLLLRNHFAFTEGCLEDEEIAALMAQLVGRPLFFAHAVLSPLIAALRADCTCDVIGKKLFLPLLQTTLREQRDSMLFEYKRLLLERPIPLVQGSNLTTRLLLRPVVDAALRGSKFLTLQRDSRMVFAFGSHGIVPWGAVLSTETTNDSSLTGDGTSNTITFDLSRESLVHDALSNIVSRVISDESAWNDYLNVMLHDQASGKMSEGTLVEEMVVAELSRRTCKALRSKAMHERRQLDAPPDGFMPLADMLQPWFPSTGDPERCHYYEDALEGFETRAFRLCAVGASSDPHGKELLRFLRSDPQGTLDIAAAPFDDEVILTDLPSEMGVDIAFLASYQVAQNRGVYRVVALQLKNTKKTCLWEAVSTIAPSFQYLTNSQRAQVTLSSYEGNTTFQAAIPHCSAPAFKRQRVQDTYRRWENFVTYVCNSYPDLACDWIRIAFVAVDVQLDVLDTLAAATRGESTFPGCAGRAPTEDETRRGRESPCLLLQLHSPTWLTIKMRRRLVKDLGAATSGSGTSRINMPQFQHYMFAACFPPTWQQTQAYIDAATRSEDLE